MHSDVEGKKRGKRRTDRLQIDALKRKNNHDFYRGGKPSKKIETKKERPPPSDSGKFVESLSPNYRRGEKKGENGKEDQGGTRPDISLLLKGGERKSKKVPARVPEPKTGGPAEVLPPRKTAEGGGWIVER